MSRSSLCQLGGEVAQAASLRRVPRQERGERRIAAILDAAEGVIAEVGYEAATTNAIAARARTSIGSLYQFFPNKDAIVRALSDRYLAELRALFDRVFAPDTFALPPRALLDAMIDPLAEFYARHAGFQPLFVTSRSLACAPPLPKDIDREVVERVEAVLAVRAPGLDEARRRLYATVSTYIVEGLLPLTISSDGGPSPRPEVVAEIKSALGAYMERTLGPDGAGA